jgi:hypothetical protein
MASIPLRTSRWHLARHGVNAQIEHTASADLPIGDVLLSRAADLAVDLLVWAPTGIPAPASFCSAGQPARCCAA